MFKFGVGFRGHVLSTSEKCLLYCNTYMYNFINLLRIVMNLYIKMHKLYDYNGMAEPSQ